MKSYPGTPSSLLQRRAPEPALRPPPEAPHLKAAAPSQPPAPPKAKPKPPSTPPVLTTTSTTTVSSISTSTATNITIGSPTANISSGPDSTTLPASAPSTDLPGSPHLPPQSTVHRGLIAGIAAGVLVLAVLAAGLLFRARKRRRREARELDEYQRRNMLNKFSDSNGSSTFGNYSDASDLGLYQPQQQQDPENRQAQLAKQPQWFANKSPLEYYKQVPPLTELKLQQHASQEQQRQELDHQQQQPHKPVQIQGANPLAQEPSSTSSILSSTTLTLCSSPLSTQEASIAARALTPVSTEQYLTRGESIALSPTSISSPTGLPSQPVATLLPYQQRQYQQPRINTHALRRPSSPAVTSQMSPPIISPPFNGNNNNSVSSPISPYPASSSPTSLSANNALYTYTPPPPAPLSPSSQPSPGFYDFLLNEDEGKKKEEEVPQLGSPVARSPRQVSGATSPKSPRSPVTSSPGRRLDSPGSAAAVSPPPIPRATRPASVSSIASLKLITGMKEHKVDASSPDVPDVPALPSFMSSS